MKKRATDKSAALKKSAQFQKSLAAFHKRNSGTDSYEQHSQNLQPQKYFEATFQFCLFIYIL